MPNPLLQRIAADELTPELAAAHEKSMRLRGDATFFEVFGNHPELYRWYSGSFYNEVFRGGLVDRHIKELIRLRLSTLHGCRFCNQGNRIDALEAGLSEQQIAQIDNYENGDFCARETAALRLADRIALTAADGTLDQSIYVQLTNHFSDAEILELGLVLGILSGVAKFMFAFDLVEKETSCPFHDTTATPDTTR